MKRNVEIKILYCVLFFNCLSISSKAQNGAISLKTFLEITESSLSSANMILKDNGYSLQYTENTEYINTKNIGWSYRMEYIPTVNKWQVPLSGNYSQIDITFTDNRIKFVLLGFNNYNLYKNYLDNLEYYGYKKDSEDVNLELNALTITFFHTTNNSMITLEESANKNGIPYFISWLK